MPNIYHVFVMHIEGLSWRFAIREPIPEDAYVAWYIYRNGTKAPIHKKHYLRGAEYDFTFEEEGKYCVRCFVKSKNSDTKETGRSEWFDVKRPPKIQIDSLEYQLEIEDGDLVFTFTNLPKKHRATFAFYVTKDKRDIYKQREYTQVPSLRYPLSGFGSYAVTYYVRQDGVSERRCSRSIPYYPLVLHMEGENMLSSFIKSIQMQQDRISKMDLLDPLQFKTGSLKTHSSAVNSENEAVDISMQFGNHKEYEDAHRILLELCRQTRTGESNQPLFHTDAQTIRELKIAAIMDQFTLESYGPECSLMELTPQGWREEIDGFQPDLLFIESAWKGKDGLWYRKIDRYSEELFSLTTYVRSLGIPIVFWNKEDPVYTDTFMITAGYADVVFTTDIDCIARYKAELGHDRVYHLHFAAQPAIHNPIEKYERKDKFCFAGAYYHRYQERTRVFDSFAAHFLEGNGLDIYDRNYPNALPEHAFPEMYQPYILGSLPSGEIDKAYKGYCYGVNMNSIQQSQTMFARRVFELLASNTVVVGNFSRGVKNYFGDLTISTDDKGTLELYLNKYCKNERERDKYRLLGLRAVLSQHLYRNRLAYIAEKVFRQNLLPPLPVVTVLANAGTVEQANRLEEMFLSQTLPNAQLVFVGAASSEQRKRYVCLGEEDVRRTLSEICGGGLAAWWEGSDWYGPNYLMDLSLTWTYGSFRAAGKSEYFCGADASLQNYGASYKAPDELLFRRALIMVKFWQDVSLAELSGDWKITGSGLMGTDYFQYCEDWPEGDCPAAADLFVADRGIPAERITQCAEAIRPLREPEDVLRIPGADLAKSKPSENVPVTYETEGSKLVIRSKLPEGKHEYLYDRAHRIEVGPWLLDGKLPVQFRGLGALDLICVLVCYDQDEQKLKPLFPKLNRRELLTLPDGTVSVEIGFRPKGSGTATVKDVIFGGSGMISERSSFLARSKVLILSNHYPSYEALYRNMFVHTRMTSYRDAGRVYDIMRMNPYAKDGYREFEGINVIEGKAGELKGILDTGTIETVCVHFLDRDMWEVLKYYLDRIRLVIWSHGADIQPWWRRTFNYDSEEDLEKEKQISEKRVELWKEVFEAQKKTDAIHFVYVSHYFANEIAEDYKVRFEEKDYSVIHNLIDSSRFSYVPKDIEQRKRILTIKPFSSKKYANDLTTMAILELSKRDFFKNIEIDIYGQGSNFDTDNGPLKCFPNVHLHPVFLRQDEIASLHKTHGVYIATTRWDSHGVSRDEAMSSGLVPIANNCTAIPEFMDDTCGILVPPEDYMGVADAIERLYNDPALFQRLSAAAAERVRNQTSKEHTIAKEIALIEGQTEEG
ncbi:MAG: glycosyltransferase [Clostridia bacterium]|nr:glycosyltransferase [Clostridia bacterium]